MLQTDCNPATGKRTIMSPLANREKSEFSTSIDLGEKVPIFDYFPFFIQCYLAQHYDLERFHGWEAVAIVRKMEQLSGEKILKKGYEPGQNSVCGKVKPRIDTIMGRW